MSEKNIKKEILSALSANKNGLSATALAKEVGFSKSSSIMDELLEMVNTDETVSVDETGRFPLYFKGGKSKKQVQVEKANTEKTVSLEIEPQKDGSVLPEAEKRMVDNYKISDIIHENKKMKKITTPEGKKIRIEEDEQLLVINGTPSFVVKTAADTLAAIRTYSQKNGLTEFTVKDICQNKKISTETDIVKDNHIIYLSIQKHNKAA